MTEEDKKVIGTTEEPSIHDFSKADLILMGQMMWEEFRYPLTDKIDEINIEFEDTKYPIHNCKEKPYHDNFKNIKSTRRYSRTHTRNHRR